MKKKYYSPAQRQATYKYKSTHIKRITLDLNHSTDTDIITWLNDQPNKTRAIKNALRPIAQDWNKKNSIITRTSCIEI